MELKDMPYWGERKPLSKFEAYLDYSDILKKNESYSVRDLSERWEWDKSKVNRFIKSDIFTLIETVSETPNETAKHRSEKSYGIQSETPNETPNETEKPKQEKINYNGLMSYFNNTFKGKLSLIQSMTEYRKKAVKARISEHGRESVRTVFNNVLASKFLLGFNDHNWRADFDWIFKAANYTKILEGNYNGERADTKTARRESISRLKDLAGAILQGSEPGNDK